MRHLLQRDTPSPAFGPSALLVMVGMLACALPSLVTRYPPAADLPQHLAQVEQALSGHQHPSAYAAWWAPNNLIYAPIAGLRAMVAAEHLASATIALLGIVWAGATCLLGARLERPAGGVALASTLFFNSSLSWGMLNFLLGWPLVLVWLAANASLPRVAFASSKSRRSTAGAIVAFVLRVVLGWLLLWAHALCFAVAFSLACLLAFRGRFYTTRLWPKTDAVTPCSTGNLESSPRVVRQRILESLGPMLPLVPTGLYATAWLLEIAEHRSERGFDVAAHYAVSFVERVDPAYFVPRSIAAGALTWALFGAIVVWILSSFFRSAAGRPWNRILALGAALLATAYLALPSKFLNTIEFSSRWLPCMWMLLVLASPGPPVSTRTTTLAGSTAALLVSASVSWNWHAFAKTELHGLSAALEATPHRARLLGLDFLRDSPLVDGRPFLHLSSYATLLRGATTHFDFSEHGTALIRGAAAATPWTPGLEWFPERARPTDLKYFDVALIGAPAEYHEQVIARLPELKPRTRLGLWRLYDIATPTSGQAAQPSKY